MKGKTSNGNQNYEKASMFLLAGLCTVTIYLYFRNLPAKILFRFHTLRL